MSCDVITMDPRDKRRVTVDFTDWLGTSIIASVNWVVPTGVTASDASNTTTAATNYFEAVSDTIENEYEIVCEAVTADSVPREKNKRFTLRVEKDC